MDKFVTVVVPQERKALDLLAALDQLDAEGMIELSAATIVGRKKDGSVEVKQTDEQRGLAALAGAPLGALLGLFAGPVGAGVGAVAGAATGTVGETAYSGVAGEYVHRVTQALKPGSWAIVAEVDEDWTLPIDDAAAAVDGQVFRQPIGDVVKAQFNAENEAGREELQQLDAEIGRSSGDAKARLEARRQTAVAAHARRTEQWRARMDQIQKNLDAKLATVREKAKRSADAAKARHEERARKLSNYVEREKEALRQLFS
jgi:uncharacterized membrane protein